MDLKVSIIIPTYNQAHYLEECVKSAIAQTYENKEIVISDDHSSDHTVEIVDSLKQINRNILYFRNEKNLGRVANYRIALNAYATGDLALVLDGDDYLFDPQYISNAVKLFEKNRDMVLVFANITTLFEPDGSLINDKVNLGLNEVLDGNWLFINYYKGFSIAHLTCLYRRQKAIELDFYRENIQSSDWESILRLIIGHQVGFINQSVGVWRKHGYNASLSIKETEVMSNLKYIDNTFKYAENLKTFTANQLEKSQMEMYKRYFFRILVQTSFFDPENLEKTKSLIRKYSLRIYRLVVFDYRYILFRIVKHFDLLLFFITKYIQKQESMYKDLKVFRKKQGVCSSSLNQ